MARTSLVLPFLTLGLIVAGCQRIASGPIDWTAFKIADDPAADEPDDEETFADEFKTKVDTPFIGEYTTISGLNVITLEGVGLVTGLDGTGGDPPPSRFRTRLLDEMRKRGVKNPNLVLASPDTALVVVRAYLPPLVQTGERFDVDVRLPGNGDATSLQGGWLLETVLAEAAVVPGRGVLKGHEFAKAAGPILVSTGEGGSHADLAGVLRRGRVLGGGVSLKDRDMSLFLRNDFRSVRNAKRIAGRIGLRFHEHNEYGIRESLAEAKTDQKVVVKIPKRYKDNFPRYLQVLRKIPFRETEVARRIRLEQAENRLNDPPTSNAAAIELEAVGSEAMPILRRALEHPALEVRFHAATALAYLEDTSGLSALVEAARVAPAFRVYALAAMASTDEGSALLALRSLLEDESAELRYGAFRAMTVIDPYDPFHAGDPLPKEDPQFRLHALEVGGEPMVHMTNFRKAEVVVFGAGQRFHTPLLVRAGRHVMVKAEPGSDQVKVSRFELGRADVREVSTRVADVIRAAAELGASYPEIAAMLVQADKQQNLPGRLEIDALPKAGMTYARPEGVPGVEDDGPRKARVGRETFVPNLFAGQETEKTGASTGDED